MTTDQTRRVMSAYFEALETGRFAEFFTADVVRTTIQSGTHQGSGAWLLQAGVLSVEGQPGQPARLGRRAPDQRRERATRDQLRLALLTWIEKTYYRRRRQDRLGRLTPIEFETLPQAAHAA